MCHKLSGEDHMMPKRIRKTIVVNGDEHEYCVTGFVTVFIKNLRTKLEIRWHQEWKPKWQQAIRPRDIRTLIETGELFGVKARLEKGI